MYDDNDKIGDNQLMAIDAVSVVSYTQSQAMSDPQRWLMALPLRHCGALLVVGLRLKQAITEHVLHFLQRTNRNY